MERSEDGLYGGRTDYPFSCSHGADGDARIDLDDQRDPALAEGFVEVKPLGPVNVKGLSDPVEVYEITGAGPVRSRLQAAAARGLTRFVGRTAELRRCAKRWSAREPAVARWSPLSANQG